MIIAILIVVGLCLGSFVNALVWRLHEQEKESAEVSRHSEPSEESQPNKILHSVQDDKLSVFRGRSMCPHCHHPLAAKDLVPVLSWLSLGGKCRYCKVPISRQYPLVELGVAALFVASYIWWPVAFGGAQTIIFILWLAILVGLVALLVYDLRWLLLPNRILYPLAALAGIQAVVIIASADDPLTAFINTAIAVIIGGGLFYILYQVSDGKWIGGGDVKLGWLLGLLVGTPAKAMLFIFVASLLGSLVSLPLLASGRLKRSSVLPFGPLLIIGTIFAVLFGSDILNWYQQAFINL